MHKRCDKISDLDYDKYSRVPKNEATYVCLSCKRISRDNYLDQLPFAEVSFTEHSPEEPNTSGTFNRHRYMGEFYAKRFTFSPFKHK